MASKNENEESSQSTPQEMKRSTNILVVVSSLVVISYPLHLFGGLGNLFRILSSPTSAGEDLRLQVRQTLFSDANTVVSTVTSFESTIPEDPAASFVYLFLVGWMVVFSLWGLGFAWIEFKDWVNRDNVDELDYSKSGGEDVAE